MKTIKETCYKGTRILLGNEKRDLINKMIIELKEQGFTEISIPIIQLQETFKGKVGEENTKMMYNFQDAKPRDLCLAPEYTAIVQKLAKSTFKNQKDIKVFYVAECFRGENPQAGRYRQFTQLGVEIINPSIDYNLDELAIDLLTSSLGYYLWNNKITKNLTEFLNKFEVNKDVTRGLDYYKEGKGFEITCNELGSSKQVCGGGAYDGGIGFALGIDRLLNLI
jgi:histidyl-tRNA synthetase